jgi:NAD(P)H-flavin reductase
MLYAPGVGEAAISISGDPNDAYRLVHTIRAVGDVTRRLQKTDEHAHVGLRGPFGGSWPLKEARGRDLVLAAGGIGIAPLRPVVYAVLADRAAFGNVHILYGTRTPGDILYQEELMRWHRHDGITVTVTVDAAGPSWKGDVGVVTRYIGNIRLDPVNTIAMICGPEIMMRFTASELLFKGIPANHIHLAMERNMKCGTAFCGHCQLGPYLLCRDGPVFRYADVARFLTIEQF